MTISSLAIALHLGGAQVQPAPPVQPPAFEEVAIAEKVDPTKLPQSEIGNPGPPAANLAEPSRLEDDPQSIVVTAKSRDVTGDRLPTDGFEPNEVGEINSEPIAGVTI